MVGGSFQSIDCVRFYVDREEVDLELLFKVPSGLDGEKASVCFLTEHVFGPLGNTTVREQYLGSCLVSLVSSHLLKLYVRGQP